MAKLIDALINRRTMIETGLLAGAGATLTPWAMASDQSSLPVIKKKIPSTGEEIPVMGIGTNAFRGDNYPQLRDVLKRMHELNGNVIDTAAMYGDSEAVIGKALAELGIRKQMFIATKFNAEGVRRPGPSPGAPLPDGGPGGPPPRGAPPLDSVYGEASFERSLMRLQTDRIDLMQAHFLSSVEPLMPLLQSLKKDGKIRYFGITTVSVQEHPQLIEYMRKYPVDFIQVDFIQVDFSLGNREAAETVFPVARERKIAVMVAVPLGGRMGSLMSQTADRQLPSRAADIDVMSWSQFLLKYVISHPAVTCAIPGSSQLEHLEENQMAGRGRIADAAMRKRMETFLDNKAPL
jgi:aryl-alcohol dehydrogenase-like predicted oxidoreductase